MKWNRFFIFFCSIAACLSIFYGCERGPAHDNKTYGDSLVIVTYHAPSSLNPLTALSGISAVLTDLSYDGLVRIDEDLKASPLLASSWDVSEDGLVWTFHLRKGVTFHDGSELTSKDVKTTLEEFIKRPANTIFSAGLSYIRAVRIKDKYTIEVILKRPSQSFISSMSVGILPSYLVGQDNFLDLAPPGTGPFKVIKWDEHEIVFKANEDYFLGRPYLDRIVVRVLPDQETAWAILMRGEGDMLLTLDPIGYDFIRQVKSMKIYNIRRLFYSMILFNNERNIFKDVRVKRGLNYAIDKEYILENILKGNGEIAAGTIWRGSPFYNPSIRPYPYMPQKALSILNKAGWQVNGSTHTLSKGGKRFSFDLYINEGDEIKKRVAMYIQQQLWELGILVNIRTFSPADMDFLFKGEYDAVFIDIFSHIYPDFNYNIWHSSKIDSGLNIGRYRSEVIDRLLEKTIDMKDPERERAVYYRFQEKLYNNPPGIFLYWADIIIAIHKRFQGVKIAPIGGLSFINEWYVPKNEQKFKR